MDDGIPNRTHRIKALGNAIVPQRAKSTPRTIMEIKAAFKEAGYVHLDDVPARLPDYRIDPHYMTGGEWYSKFAVLAKSSGYYSGDLPMMKLARKAANLE